MWKENDKWTGRRIALFKRKGLSRFKFQAGADVIKANTELEAKERFYAFMRRFVDSPFVMEVNLRDSKVSMDDYDYLDILSPEEKEALRTELAEPLAGLLSGEPPGKMVTYDALSLTLSDPIILDQNGNKKELSELEQLEAKQKLGENIFERTPEQQAQARKEIKEALISEIDKLSITDIQRAELMKVCMDNLFHIRTTAGTVSHE